MRYLLLILAGLFSSGVGAGIYKCTDGKGKTEYRGSTCTSGHENLELNIKTGTATNLDEQSRQESSLLKLQQAEAEKSRNEQLEAEKKQANINKAAVIASAKNQFLIKSNPGKYSAYAIPPYVPGKLTELVKTFESRLDEIELLRQKAGQKALDGGQCGRVESVELHSKSTKDALLFFVSCSSSKSFHFKEQELVKPPSP